MDLLSPHLTLFSMPVLILAAGTVFPLLVVVGQSAAMVGAEVAEVAEVLVEEEVLLGAEAPVVTQLKQYQLNHPRLHLHLLILLAPQLLVSNLR